MTCEPLVLSDTAMVLLRRHQQLEEEMDITDARIQEERAHSRHGRTDVEADMEALFSYHAALFLERQPVPYELMVELWLLWSSPDLVPVRHLDWHLVLEGDLLAELEELFIPAPTPLGIRRHDIVMRRYPSIGTFIDHMLAAIAQTKPEESCV